MRKTILVAMMILALSSSAEAKKAPKLPRGIYPKTVIVTVVKRVKGKRYQITGKDCSGRLFAWYADGDWVPGELASLIMFDNGSVRVSDDKVLDARYAGTLNCFR